MEFSAPFSAFFGDFRGFLLKNKTFSALFIKKYAFLLKSKDIFWRVCLFFVILHQIFKTGGKIHATKIRKKLIQTK